MTPAPIRRLAGTLTALAIAATIAACTSGDGASPAASAAAPSSGTVAATECPLTQPDPLPAGETRTVTMDTTEGTITIALDADLSPIAVGNFAALAGCGYYDGVVFHRTVPGFVIQGGDPTGTGTGGPGYTIKDEPVTTDYHRGTVAMARTAAPDSVGSQFFIVTDDAAAGALSSANTYQIIGEVTDGMDVVDAIVAKPNSGDETGNMAIDPVTMTSVTVSNP